MKRARATAAAAVVCALAAAALIAGSPRAARAGRLCGTVRSAGSAIAGAHVVVLERGLLADSDSTGLFCIDGLDSGTFTLRVLAIGYQPGERVVATVDTARVHFELVPMRGAGSWSAAGTGRQRAEASGALVPEATSPPSSPTDTTARAEHRKIPLLVLAADSAWLASKHKGSNWDSLLVLHDQLLRGPTSPDPGPRASYWRALEQRLADLHVIQCAAERPVRRRLSPPACAYLARARAVAEARAAYLRGKDVSRNTRVYLRSLASSSNPRVTSWARDLLEVTRARAGAGADSNPRP